MKIETNQFKDIVNQGIASHNNSEFNKAFEKYEEALAIDPKSPLANYQIATLYLELDEPGKA